MASWNDLTTEQKIAHRAECAAAKAAFEAIESERKDTSEWVGKNAPSARPFGHDTVETSALSSLSARSQAAWDKYITLVSQYK